MTGRTDSLLLNWSRGAALCAAVGGLALLSTAQTAAHSSVTHTPLAEVMAAGVITVPMFTPPPPPAPPNDNVCNATPLPLLVEGQGNPTQFTNVNATTESGEVSPGQGSAGAPPGCQSQDGWCRSDTGVQKSVWFSFVAPTCGCVSIRINTQDDGVTTDFQLALWNVRFCNNFLTFAKVAANDNRTGGDLDPFIENACGLTPGRTYYIQVDGWQGDAGTGRIGVTTGPVNDCCDGAIQVWDLSIVNGSTRRALPDPEPSCSVSTESNGFGVWYKLLGDGNPYVASTCSPNTDFDTELTVYTGSCGSLTCIGGDDDFAGTLACPHNILASQVQFCTQPGQWYYILVDGHFAARGDFSMRVASVASGYDCDCNGIADECDIEFDPSLDQDNSGFLDSCEDCPDPNCDGFVWWPDAWFIIANYGATGPHPADVNFDGIVDFHDYLKVIFHLGQFCEFTSGGWWWWWL